jgi:hypothetical protein
MLTTVQGRLPDLVRAEEEAVKAVDEAKAKVGVLPVVCPHHVCFIWRV